MHGPRLAGHGTSPQDMARTTAEDWVRSVEAGLRRLERPPPLGHVVVHDTAHRAAALDGAPSDAVRAVLARRLADDPR